MNKDNNSKAFHTGKKCIEKGCNRPAGTAWSPYWCAECNAARLKRITSKLNDKLKVCWNDK